mgnify:CR=1 FL=1
MALDAYVDVGEVGAKSGSIEFPPGDIHAAGVCILI